MKVSRKRKTRKRRRVKRNKSLDSRKYIRVIGIFLIFLFLILLLRTKTNIRSSEYDNFIKKYSKEYKLDEDLVLGIIKAESDFNKDAKSNVGAIGLMQIMPETGQWISKQLNEDFYPDMLLDPETNIRYGTYYISYLLDRYGYDHLALAAYNGGPSNVDKWIEKGILDNSLASSDNIPFSETRNYVKKVLKYKEEFKNGKK